MSEKEKMVRGEFYNAMDPELVADRTRAQELFFRYNEIAPGDGATKKQILTELFGYDIECIIEPPFKCDYGYNIKIGAGFYANFGVVILDVNRVTIGDNVMFGPNVQVYSATHPTDPAERLSGSEMGYPITIGDNCWIGGGAIICPGVTIGKDTVIGAGSVVTRDIPERVVAAGNPCRVIRKV
jgi:maltose O-acetyltransferase